MTKSDAFGLFLIIFAVCMVLWAVRCGSGAY